MKIALINAFWGFGSTGRNTITKRALLQEEGYDVRVYYGMKKQNNTPKDVLFCGNKIISFLHHVLAYFFGLAGYGSVLPTRKLIGMLKKFKPDVIWLYNIHGYYLNESMLFRFLKKSNIWVVYDMADEYAFLGKCCSSFECKKFETEEGCSNCSHLQDYPRSRFFDNSRRKFKQKKKLYNGLNRVVFRSAYYVIEKAKSSFLLKDKEMAEIDTAIDVYDVFYPRKTDALRKELNIADNAKIVLCCAPLNDPLKGVSYFMEAAKLCANENIVFVNVSYGADESLCPPNYIPISYVSNRDKMAEFYSLADVYVCPSISDAQPNTCIEAMGCGTPIIGFNISGVPYLAPEDIGTYVAPKNAAALADTIKDAPFKDEIIINKCRTYACKRYSNEVVNNVTKSFFKEICTRVERDKDTYKF